TSSAPSSLSPSSRADADDGVATVARVRSRESADSKVLTRMSIQLERHGLLEPTRDRRAVVLSRLKLPGLCGRDGRCLEDALRLCFEDLHALDRTVGGDEEVELDVALNATLPRSLGKDRGVLSTRNGLLVDGFF